MTWRAAWTSSEQRTCRDVLELKCREFAAKEAIVFEDRDGNVIRYTYQELDELVNKYANIILSKGIKKGDKVTVHLVNSPEYLFAWFALAKIGAVMIPTNVLAGAFELEYYLEFSESVAVITEPAYLELFNGLAEKCPKIGHMFLTRTSPRYPGAADCRALPQGNAQRCQRAG